MNQTAKYSGADIVEELNIEHFSKSLKKTVAPYRVPSDFTDVLRYYKKLLKRTVKAFYKSKRMKKIRHGLFLYVVFNFPCFRLNYTVRKVSIRTANRIVQLIYRYLGMYSGTHNVNEYKVLEGIIKEGKVRLLYMNKRKNRGSVYYITEGILG